MNCKSAGSSAGHCWLVKCQRSTCKKRTMTMMHLYACERREPLSLSVCLHESAGTYTSVWWDFGCVIMLTCRQQCSKHKVPHIPHISDVSTVISLLIPRREGQGTFPSQIKLRLLKPFCCQITSLNNSLAPLFSVHFMEGILSFASHFWLSPVLFFHRFISYPNKSQDCEAHD